MHGRLGFLNRVCSESTSFRICTKTRGGAGRRRLDRRQFVVSVSPSRLGGRAPAKLEKLLDQAQEHLDEGEEVLATGGTYETKKIGNDWTRAGILVATDLRVVFYAKKVGGYDLEVFPYKSISSIETGKGMGGNHVKFFASGNEVRLKWIDKKSDVGEPGRKVWIRRV